MQTTLSNFGFGVISGVVATLLIVVIGQFWKKIFLPWYEDVVYKGVRIDGKWSGKSTIRGIDRKATWQIKQTGHRIKATTISLSGPNEGKHFIVKGSFQNQILTVTFQRLDSENAIDRGCVTAKLAPTVNELRGYMTHQHDDDGIIASDQYVLTRD